MILTAEPISIVNTGKKRDWCDFLTLTSNDIAFQYSQGTASYFGIDFLAKVLHAFSRCHLTVNSTNEKLGKE